MPDPAERFIAAATAPLGDNAELQMMAAQELRAAIVFGPLRQHCDSLETAATHLAAQRSRVPGRTIFYALTTLIAVAAAVPVIRDFLKIRAGMNSVIGLGGNPMALMPEISGTLSPPQKLLLFGDPAASTWPDRYRALWASDGMNPMLFADHARARAESNERLPADFIVTADLLDPDNGWFRHLAAGVEARDTTEFEKVPYRISKHGGRFPDYQIKSPSGVAMALRRMSESAAATRYDPYESEMYRKRLEVPPARRLDGPSSPRSRGSRRRRGLGAGVIGA
jgi:hypothetical protein